MNRYRLLGVLSVLVSLTPLSALAAGHDTASVTVVHGVPDLVVDVYVDDQKVLEGFSFGMVTDPLPLAPNSYRLAIRPAGADPTSDPVLSAEATLKAGDNVSIVAHLAEDGQPRLSIFVNDLSTIAAGKGRVVVRHMAQAPAVDVRAGGAVLFANLSNPNEAKGDVDAGTYAVDLTPAGQGTVVFGPVNLPVNAGVSTIVYAIGSLEGGTFTLATQTISGLGPAPTQVDTGFGASSVAVHYPMQLLVVLGLLGIIGLAVPLRRGLAAAVRSLPIRNR